MPFYFLGNKSLKASKKVKMLDPYNPNNIRRKDNKTRQEQIRKILTTPVPDNAAPKIPFHKFRPRKAPRTRVDFVYIRADNGEYEMKQVEQVEMEDFATRTGVLTRVEPGELTDETEK